MIPSLIHAAIVHFPIALLICGSLAILGYIHRWPQVELRIVGWWLILSGWLTLLAAIISGIVAQGGLPPEAPYRRVLNWHTGSGLALAALYGALLYQGWRRAIRKGAAKASGSDSALDFLMAPGRQMAECASARKRRGLLTAQLLLGIGLVILSGWLGGQLVYEFGVGVR